MKDRIKKALLSIGVENIKVEENKKSKENKHRSFFLKILNTLTSVQERSEKIFEGYGINLIMYEDLYYQVIEDLIYEHYGNQVAEVMFWWVTACSKLENNGEDNFYIVEEKTNKRHKVKTPIQVYNICKKMKIFKK
jgi:hypothetical protein|tara:strand:+ start:5765 stop:6172 length:408 start_codon:yes stop_codon:yes gene_type:complete